ncbi:MAG TPA: hypothetical protein G4N93_06365 [Dehalococcoidia bacterium]|nr:hypothetical protein [Dehalococcoidia bacterium]
MYNKLTTGLGPTWLLILAFLIVSLLSLPACNQADDLSGSSLKAAIIDQLYSLQPNEAAIQQMTRELEGYGFEVDVYQGDEVTVDFYGELPGYGYDLIIFRAHSGLLKRDGETIEKTCLFTDEPYSETRHITQQLTEQLAMARISEHYPWVFAIGSKFVTQSMDGEFDNTVIIMMGCSCLYLDDLATAFIDKGASTYLGWDASVSLDYVDKATPILVTNLCAKQMTIRRAVDETMAEVGADPDYGACLNYYPATSGSQTVKELISGMTPTEIATSFYQRTRNDKEGGERGALVQIDR